MRIKPNCIDELMSMGIKKKHATAIQGQSCKLTGLGGLTWTQVEFDGELLGWKIPFVFCVPNTALEL